MRHPAIQTMCAIMQNNDGPLRSKKYFITARAVKECVDGLVELFACNCDADGLQLQLLLGPVCHFFLQWEMAYSIKA